MPDRMAEQRLVATPRDGAGKGVARKLRAAGRVPAVLYGHGMDPLSLSVDALELLHVFHTGAGTNVLVDLEVDGTEHLAMPREIQRDHIKGKYIHVDFLVVRRDERITLSVPVRIVGESPGVKAGGVVEHHLWELQVECLPTNVPEAIEADISSLDIGSSLRVSDLVAPDGVTILSNPEDSVVAVQQPQAPVELEEEEAAAEAAEGEAAAEEGEGAEGAAEQAEGAAEQSEG
jgi:large subunit ribosomal protein L25